MSTVIDILLVAILAFFIVWFTKYGFARTVFKIGKTWLSLVVSVVVGPAISGRIEAWFLSDNITNKVCDVLDAALSSSTTGRNIKALFDNLPGGFVSFLKTLDISAEGLEATYGSTTEPSREMLMAISERISAPIASLVSSILGHVICFLITFFFFRWINHQIRKRRVSFLRYVDHGFGFIVGLALGCTMVIVTSMLLHTVLQVVMAFHADSSAIMLYENSHIFKFVAGLDAFGMLKQMIIK